MDEQYVTEVPMDADTLRTMGTALIKPSTRLNLLAAGGGLLILSIILLTQGNLDYCLLSVLALAVYSLGVTIYARQAVKRAIEDMKRETGGAGWMEHVGFLAEGIHHHIGSCDELVPYSTLTQVDQRGGLLVLHTKTQRMAVLFTQLEKQEQDALCSLLWQKCPGLDMPRKLHPVKSKGEKLHDSGSDNSQAS